MSSFHDRGKRKFDSFPGRTSDYCMTPSSDFLCRISFAHEKPGGLAKRSVLHDMKTRNLKKSAFPSPQNKQKKVQTISKPTPVRFLPLRRPQRPRHKYRTSWNRGRRCTSSCTLCTRHIRGMQQMTSDTFELRTQAQKKKQERKRALVFLHNSP